MHLYKINVLELHSFQRLMNTLCDTGCTEVRWLPSSVLSDLCSNYDVISRQMLDGPTQQLHTEEQAA